MTSYWFPGSQEIVNGQSVRFTTTPKTFCIVSLTAPKNGKLTIQKRLPILPGDEVSLLGPGNGTATALPWTVDSTGKLTVNVPDSAVAAGKFAWAFKVSYKNQ
ncbi:hypothetical protein H0H81_008130 [Sphagnurus paluster]|uniref:Uncharacterized protein n=1 Tax=Sphagnurus paluster TaxID=117069 RepID=A0A9P7K500_9AGAR|nr:hypothetical protein H0H81_008130 [Sphagnurus paluster]